jgi:hypothetical protein
MFQSTIHQSDQLVHEPASRTNHVFGWQSFRIAYIDAFWLARDAKTPFVYVITAYTLYGWY